MIQDFLKPQGQSFDLIDSYLNDLNSLVDLVKGNSKYAACVPDHFYEKNRAALVGHEFPLREAGELFYFYKSGHEETKKILEEMKALHAGGE